MLYYLTEEMKIGRGGLPLLIHNLCCEWGGGAMIEAILLEMIYLLLFGLVVETIIVFALVIMVIILSK